MCSMFQCIFNDKAYSLLTGSLRSGLEMLMVMTLEIWRMILVGMMMMIMAKTEMRRKPQDGLL